jgi:hypothetical protein
VFVSDTSTAFLTTLFGNSRDGRSSSITILAINDQLYALVVGALCQGHNEGRTVAVLYRLDPEESVPVYVNGNWRFGF